MNKDTQTRVKTSYSRWEKPVQPCSSEGCASKAKSKGLCIFHGGGKRCAIEGCKSGSKKGGLCSKHGGGLRCAERGCPNGAQFRGKCIAHGGRKLCSVESCQQASVTWMYCANHESHLVCERNGCKRNTYGKTLCAFHGGAKCIIPACTRRARMGLKCLTHREVSFDGLTPECSKQSNVERVTNRTENTQITTYNSMPNYSEEFVQNPKEETHYSSNTAFRQLPGIDYLYIHPTHQSANIDDVYAATPHPSGALHLAYSDEMNTQHLPSHQRSEALNLGHNVTNISCVESERLRFWDVPTYHTTYAPRNVPNHNTQIRLLGGHPTSDRQGYNSTMQPHETESMYRRNVHSPMTHHDYYPSYERLRPISLQDSQDTRTYQRTEQPYSTGPNNLNGWRC